MIIRSVLLLALALISVSAAACSSRNTSEVPLQDHGKTTTSSAVPTVSSPPPQHHFQVDGGEIERPVRLPDSVVRDLEQDERVRSCMDESPSAAGINAWFKASETDLNDDHRPDLIILPDNGCLNGANINPFWVFQNANSGYKLVLRVDALGLDVLEEKTQGYCNVEASAVVGNESVVTVVYGFKDFKYEVAGRREEKIK